MRTVGYLLIIIVLLGIACDDVGEQVGPVEPVYGDAELVRLDRQSDAEPYEPPQGDNMCTTTDATYESDAEGEEIVGFYEERGFELLGEAGYEDGELIRWIGERGDDPETWRRVDIFSPVGGPTSSIISEANC